MKRSITLLMILLMIFTIQSEIVSLESENGIVDSKLPEITFISPISNSIFIPEENIEVSFLIDEDYFPDSPETPIKISIFLNNQQIVSEDISITAEESGDYSIDWMLPDVVSENCHFRISATDFFGNINTTDSETFEIYELSADFEANPISGYVPFNVQFTDLSIGDVLSWEWDFNNDGEVDSYEQNPTWTLNLPGTYSVSLTVFDNRSRETDTEIKIDYIIAEENNYPDWSVYYADYEYSGSIWGVVNLDDVEVNHDTGMLGCFVGDECRGIAQGSDNSAQYIEYFDRFFYMPMIYSNVTSGETITFQYYDPITQVVYPVSETIEFQSDMFVGDGFNPFEFNARSTTVISKEMISGWNWLSVNVSDEDMSANHVLASLGDNAQNIKSQTQSAIYYPGPGWLGSLTMMNNLTFYKVNTNNSVLFEFEGYPLNLDETVYELISGWNWVSYAPQESEDINYAYSTIQYGTNIKSQTQSAIYYPGPGWLGSLTNLNPLDGYMLKMDEAETFTYPDPEGVAGFSSLSESVLCKEVSSELRDFGWSVDPHAYEFNGSLWSIVEVDGEFADDIDDCLAVFSGDECRGLACKVDNSVQDYSEIFGNTFFMPMVYSNMTEGEELSFKYYDASEETVYDVAETVMFESDMVIGNGYEPFVMHAVMTDGSEDELMLAEAFNCYPNPFNPETTITFFTTEGTENTELCVYNLKGQKVCTLVSGILDVGKHEVIWNAQSQSSGIYYMKLQTGNNVQYKKVILLK